MYFIQLIFRYLGRKTLLGITEKCVNGTDFLVWPNYSHWTLAYALSKNGAKKLTNRNYLKQLVPIDEYFPILYDKHPGYVNYSVVESKIL